jgi:glycosyltransferase involved in cell wall biosynthesis
MDVFVLPSLSEGCPHVLLEAMAAGCPIVATRTGAIPEIIRDGETGILVDPGDSFQIEEAVRHLFRHPEEAKAMGRRAHEKVDEFSEEGEREGWREVYRLIGGGLDSAVRFS